MKATPRVRKIALLGKFAYPELRLNNKLIHHGFRSACHPNSDTVMCDSYT
jgi:hypothetical protein